MLDDNNKLIFSPSTANKKGYKWLVFSGISMVTEALSSGKGKTKKKINVTHVKPVSTAINMDFDMKLLSKSAKNANPYLTKSYLEGMKRIFEPYVDEQGIFSYENLPEFAKYINKVEEVNSEDLLEDDPMGYYEDDEGEDE
jgi:hypothetical protein